MNKIINYIVIICSFIIIGMIMLIDLTSTIELTIINKCIIYSFVMLMILASTTYQIKKYNEKIRSNNLKVLFIIYILFLISITFLANVYENNIIDYGSEYYAVIKQNSINLIPFKTIISFINRVATNQIGLKIVIENLLGNFILFMPFAFFIPTLLKKHINNLKKYILCMSVIIISKEVLQHICGCGALDIDDIILNIIGTIVAYLILQSKNIKRIINKLLY